MRRRKEITMKVIKNANGSYTHISTTGIETNNLKVVFDKRKGCGDIKLPGGASHKWLSESRFHDGITEIILGEPTTRTNTPATPSLTWEDFVEEDDKVILGPIKAKAEAKMKVKAIEDQIAIELAKVEALKALIAKTEETEETKEVEEA
jgi:hypothetical protein